MLQANCGLWQEGVVCVGEGSVAFRWGAPGGLAGVDPGPSTGSSNELQEATDVRQ